MQPKPEILLIEDSPDDRDLFIAAVKTCSLNAVVTSALDAAQAVIRLNRLGQFAGFPLPALIILDLHLPGLQGKTFLQIIRNAYGQEFIPVIIMTGSISEKDRIECEEMGITDFIVKPHKHEDLIHVVSALRLFLPNQPVAPDVLILDSIKRL